MSPEGTPVTRILIADDHEVVRFGLRAILEAHEGWEVVAEACDGKEAIAKAVETSPDVAILDYSLPMMNGVEATRQIRARVPTAEVLIFTMHDSEVPGRRVAGGRSARLSAQIGCQAISPRGRGIAGQSQAVFYRKGLGTIARYLPRKGTRQARRCLVAAGTPDRSIDCGRSQQQGNDRDSQSQRQDDRNTPRGGDAQAQRYFDRHNRPLCHSQQAGGALEALRLRYPECGTHSDTGAR